jgi:hypothetical protein
MEEMKTLVYSCVMICGFGFSYNLFFDHVKAKRFLGFEGKIYQTGWDARCTKKVLDSALVVIFNEGDCTTDSLLFTEGGNYDFGLPLNSQFMVSVCKSGFVAKKLHINTNVPRFYREETTMEFEMDLYKKIDAVDASILDNPVAEIYYNVQLKDFDYDKAFTDEVNRKVKTAYEEYYRKNAKTKAMIISR